MIHPVDEIEWVHAGELTGADYNPNHVATAELNLLAQSMLEDGWTQPLVIRPDGQIVDGHHRFLVSGDFPDDLRPGGKVPCVTLRGKAESDLRISTIRHNRARGAHTIDGMVENMDYIINESGLDEEEVATRLGMEQEEIERLAAHVSLPDKHEDADYEREWRPSDVK